MGTDVVVIIQPCRQEPPSVSEAVEHVLVQAFVSDPSVQTFGVAVFSWLARRNVVPFDGLLLRPCQNRTARKLRSVVADDAQGLAVADDQHIQFPHDPRAADGRIRQQRQTFTRALIHDTQDAEPPSVRQRIAQEVQAPDLIEAVRLRQRQTRPDGSFTAFSAFDHQAFLPVNAIDFLEVTHKTLALEHHRQPLIAKPPTLSRDPLHGDP